MTAVTLAERESNGSMAEPALLTVQNVQHADAAGTRLGFEQMLMTILAIQPHGVGFVGKSDDRHAAVQIKQDVFVEHIHLGFREDIRARVDQALFERMHPSHLIADIIRRQFGQSIAGLHQFFYGRAGRVMNSIAIKRPPVSCDGIDGTSHQ